MSHEPVKSILTKNIHDKTGTQTSMFYSVFELTVYDYFKKSIIRVEFCWKPSPKSILRFLTYLHVSSKKYVHKKMIFCDHNDINDFILEFGPKANVGIVYTIIFGLFKR